MLKTIIDTILTPQVNPQDTPQVKKLLSVLNVAMTRQEILDALSLKDRKSLRERYLSPAIAQGLVEMTIPDKPNSRSQQYRLTVRGQALKKSL